MRNFIVSFLLCFVLLGCAEIDTKITGFVDPEYQGKNFKISKVIIQASGTTLADTQLIEKRASEQLKQYNTNIIKFTDIAPPTRGYTPEKYRDLILQTKADSIFTIYIRKSTFEHYVPLVYHQGVETTRATTVGNITRINTQRAPGYTTGGYTATEPAIVVISHLTDTHTGKKIWISEGTSLGDENSSHEDLILDIVDGSIADMHAKGLLHINKKDNQKNKK